MDEIYGLSYITDATAQSRGYDDAHYQEGMWVVERDGEWVVDLPRATATFRETGSSRDAKQEALRALGLDTQEWTWKDAGSGDRDYIAVRD